MAALNFFLLLSFSSESFSFKISNFWKIPSYFQFSIKFTRIEIPSFTGHEKTGMAQKTLPAAGNSTAHETPAKAHHKPIPREIQKSSVLFANFQEKAIRRPESGRGCRLRGGV
jgi:hypothetical protein